MAGSKIQKENKSSSRSSLSTYIKCLTVYSKTVLITLILINFKGFHRHNTFLVKESLDDMMFLVLLLTNYLYYCYHVSQITAKLI